jgi:hypothetical protein
MSSFRKSSTGILAIRRGRYIDIIYTRARCNGPYSAQSFSPVLQSEPLITHSDTNLLRTFWSRGPTSALSKICWGTKTFRRR